MSSVDARAAPEALPTADVKSNEEVTERFVCNVLERAIARLFVDNILRDVVDDSSSSDESTSSVSSNE